MPELVWKRFIDLEAHGLIRGARHMRKQALEPSSGALRASAPPKSLSRSSLVCAMESVPPIRRARFGLEQRCSYRHADLYDEEVPEVDLETVIAAPQLGATTAARSFVLLGDQNAGKSTMLHSRSEGRRSSFHMSFLCT